MKLKNSNCDKNQKNQIVMKLKLWSTLKTQIVIKLKNLNCDKIKKKLKLWSNSKTQMVTNLYLWQNSSCDKTQHWQSLICDKTQVVTKLKLWQNSNCEKKYPKLKYDKKFHKRNQTQIVIKLKNSNCDETQKLILRYNSNQIVIKLNSNCDKVQKLKLW